VNLSKIGHAPDYRFTLANERTFLAWIRTSLGFLAAGVALHQLSLNMGNGTIWPSLALFLCLISAALSMHGYWRWRSTEEAMRLNRDISYTSAQRLVAVTMFLFVVAVTWCLYRGN